MLRRVIVAWYLGPDQSQVFIDKDDAILLDVIKKIGLYNKSTK